MCACVRACVRACVCVCASNVQLRNVKGLAAGKNTPVFCFQTHKNTTILSLLNLVKLSITLNVKLYFRKQLQTARWKEAAREQRRTQQRTQYLEGSLDTSVIGDVLPKRQVPVDL